VAINGPTDVDGTLSGSSLLTLSRYSSCNLETTATGMVICGTDDTGVGGAAGNFLLKSGGTVTGALTIQNGNTHTNTATPTLNVRGIASGATIRAQNMLSSSGAFTFEGAGSGATLVVSSQFSGAGLVDCDLATQTLAWDSGTNRFSCGTDSDTTYQAGQGLTLTNGVFILSASHSGSTIWATTSLRSSGSLTVEGTTSGSLFIANTSSSAMLRYRAMSPYRVQLEVFASGSTVKVGSGMMMFTVADPNMSGAYLKSAHLSVQTAGVTNTTSIQIRNAAKGNRKFFSTPISIDSGETGSDTAAAAYVIDAANKDIGAYDRLLIDLPSVSTTAPKGSVQLFLEFYKP
jgi:hypothetical protein